MNCHDNQHITWKYSNNNQTTHPVEKDGVVFITYPILTAAGIRHGCSTRIGGVSEGHLSSMNLSYNRGDDPCHVTENYKRIGQAIGFDYRDLVLSDQIHETHIRRAFAADRGDGILRPTMEGIDAIITDEPGVPIAVSTADCVPVLLYDTKHKAVAAIHAGWRGTVNMIVPKTIKRMAEDFHTDPADLLAVVGPSICRACYEVSEDVADQFREAFPEEEWPLIMDVKGGGKYQLDLWEANRLLLLGAGVLAEQISVTDLCTCCNHDRLFSHRASKGLRGNLNSFIVL